MINGMSEMSLCSLLNDRLRESMESKSMVTSLGHLAFRDAIRRSHHALSVIPRVSSPPTWNNPRVMLKPLSMRDTPYRDRSSLGVHRPLVMMRVTDAALAYLCQSLSVLLLNRSLPTMR